MKEATNYGMDFFSLHAQVDTIECYEGWRINAVLQMYERSAKLHYRTRDVVMQFENVYLVIENYALHLHSP